MSFDDVNARVRALRLARQAESNRDQNERVAKQHQAMTTSATVTTLAAAFLDWTKKSYVRPDFKFQKTRIFGKQEFGWRLGSGDTARHRDDQSYTAHALVLRPNGELVDVATGVRCSDSIVTPYSSSGFMYDLKDVTDHISEFVARSNVPFPLP